MPDDSQPTDRDIANAEYRASVAARMAEEYGRVRGWALVFGEGWLPSCRHYLVDKDEEERVRYTSDRPVAAATVYTVKNRAGEQRHFTVDVEGRVTQHATWEEGFGAMLREPHPTRLTEVRGQLVAPHRYSLPRGDDRLGKLVVRGQLVAPHRYSLCFAPYELYRPRTADQLAAGRERRQAAAVERDAEEMPLFAEQIRAEVLPAAHMVASRLRFSKVCAISRAWPTQLSPTPRSGPRSFPSPSTCRGCRR